MNQKPERKKLNLQASVFKPNLETTPIQILEYNQFPQQEQPQKKKNKKKKKKFIVDEEIRKQYIVPKSKNNNLQMNEVIQFDNKLGEWSYSTQELKALKEKIRQQKEKAVRDLEQWRMQKEKKLQQVKDLKTRFIVRLGLKKVNKLIYELKKKIKGSEKKMEQQQFKFEVNETGNIEIVKKEKKRKFTKLRKAQMSFNDGYETVEEVPDTELIIKKLELLNPNPNRVYNMMPIRGWVDMHPCREVDDQILMVVNKLIVMQVKKQILEPKRAKKRIVAGINEVKRTLTTSLSEKRSKLVIMAINIKRNPFMDEKMVEILQMCAREGIEVVHGCNRSKLAYAYLGKWGPKICVVSIINYQGLDEDFQRLMDMVRYQKNVFQSMYGPFEMKRHLLEWE